MMKSLLLYFTKEPKKLFQLDAIGALITATFMGVVMKNNVETFGLPSEIAFYCVVIALSFFCYSTLCFFFIRKNWQQMLVIIAIGNTLYTVITTFFLFTLYSQLTTFGMPYLISEILVITTLVTIEFTVAKKLGQKK